MVSVTKRINQIKQPRGGYINPSEFDDTIELGAENIHPILMGITVDYLTRIANGSSTQDAFRISFYGATKVHEEKYANELMLYIEAEGWESNTSIEYACKLSGFDTVYRAGPQTYKPVQEINPDATTIDNIRIMVRRGLYFIQEFGPIVKDGFTFDGGYTKTITSGDGDFLTNDTLWDFKVSKVKLTNKQTFQLLIYYLMGIHSNQGEFKFIKRLGIFNPRLNRVYMYDLNKLDKEIIERIEKDVIGYN